jgi:hypothetical protein
MPKRKSAAIHVKEQMKGQERRRNLRQVIMYLDYSKYTKHIFMKQGVREGCTCFYTTYHRRSGQHGTA